MGIALDFLRTRHRLAVDAALEEFLDPEGAEDDLPRLDPEIAEAIEIARFEWLLAEAELEVGDRFVSAYELLVGTGGPRLTAAEREALRELAERPRRLYEVEAVRPGESIVVRDVVRAGAEPVTMVERTASLSLSEGAVVALRLVRNPGDGSWSPSGPLYAMPRSYLQPLREEIREIEQRYLPEDARYLISDRLTGAWISYLTLGPPKLVHAGSDEELLLTTDHFQVIDAAALRAALEAQEDVRSDGDGAWSRVDTSGDRVLTSLSLEGSELELFAPTRGLADEGREWLAEIAGGAVESGLREHVDPHSEKALAAASSRTKAPVELPPEVRQEILEESYDDWAEVPIPALGDETPRKAMETELGRERVEALLLDYEHSERLQAEHEGREPISFEFLWRRIGLERSGR